MNDLSDGDSAPSRFRTTAWSIVASAQDNTAPDYNASIEYLCKRYWKPVYNYIRRRGWNHEEAADYAQEYFATFLEKSYIKSADKEKGKFRTFLLTTLSRFLSKAYKKKTRAGKSVSLTYGGENDSEPISHPKLSVDYTAEDEFNKAWARNLIEQTLIRMETECTEGKTALYGQVFRAYIESMTSATPKTYREIGITLNITESDVTNYLHRGRNIFQKFLRDEIRHSVLTESEIDEELVELQQYFS
jgi:RNA polymerase sigma-70 factor (ECF subfamily)